LPTARRLGADTWANCLAISAQLSQEGGDRTTTLRRRAPTCRQFPPRTASLSISVTQIKEETFLAILLFITGKPGLQGEADLVPIRSPLDSPNFTVTTFIEGCSRSDPMQQLTFLRSLSTSDVVVWTDGSVPSPLGAGDVQVVFRRCSSSSSLSCLL